MDRADETFSGTGDPWSVKVTRERILWMAQWSRGPVVLDCGCGQGTTFHLLESKIEKYVGYDISAEAIAAAQTLASELAA